MFLRRKLNRSGSTSVQVIEKRGNRNVLVKTIGCSKDSNELKRLDAEGFIFIKEQNKQLSLNFGITKEEQSARELLETASVRLVGPELILGKIFDSIGFGDFGEPLFKEIVIARLVYPGSKLKTTEYLRQYKDINVGVDQVYRFLDRLNNLYKPFVEKVTYEYTKRILGGIRVAFYDATTLYFEAEQEDDLRKIGYSKDGKFTCPQIVLGLLVGDDGYPISYHIFEGNTFEGHTLLAMIEKAKQLFDIKDPTIIADSALLSKDNIELLDALGYHYILGARIKNEPLAFQREILTKSSTLKDKQYCTLKKSASTRLIVEYSDKRARKDEHNRKRGISRLNDQIKSGKLSKKSINNRGYNKFLKLNGTLAVEIDIAKVDDDCRWDGLKGYVTNAPISDNEIIKNYRQLWKIERAFRISKTDLRIRPIYHRKRSRIEAHICVAFVAYTVFKELERILTLNKFTYSTQKAIELTKTIYEIKAFLPDLKKYVQAFSNLSDEQRILLRIFNSG
jgi:transposase